MSEVKFSDPAWTDHLESVRFSVTDGSKTCQFLVARTTLEVLDSGPNDHFAKDLDLYKNWARPQSAAAELFKSMKDGEARVITLEMLKKAN